VRDFAERARTLDPRSLVREATALLKQEKDAAISRVVLRTLRGLQGDIEEHGDHSEYADEESFVKRAVSTWAKQVGDDAEDVLLADDLESSLVAVVPSGDITPAELKDWKVLTQSRRLATALTALVKKPVSPWFAELAAAYIGREVRHIAKSSRAESWQSKLDDVPVLLGLLPGLGMPPLFAPRVLRAANLVVLRHKHEPTREALAALGGGPKVSAADTDRADRILRSAAVRKAVRAASARRAAKTKTPQHAATPKTPRGAAKTQTPGGAAKPKMPRGAAKLKTPGGAATPKTPRRAATPKTPRAAKTARRTSKAR
jgi:hypothetical protein